MQGSLQKKRLIREPKRLSDYFARAAKDRQLVL